MLQRSSWCGCVYLSTTFNGVNFPQKPFGVVKYYKVLCINTGDINKTKQMHITCTEEPLLPHSHQVRPLAVCSSTEHPQAVEWHCDGAPLVNLGVRLYVYSALCLHWYNMVDDSG